MLLIPGKMPKNYHGGGGAPAGSNTQNDLGSFGGTPVSDDDIPF